MHRQLYQLIDPAPHVVHLFGFRETLTGVQNLEHRMQNLEQQRDQWGTKYEVRAEIQ